MGLKGNFRYWKVEKGWLGRNRWESHDWKFETKILSDCFGWVVQPKAEKRHVEMIKE